MYGKLQLNVQPLCRNDIFSLVKESKRLCFTNEGTINYTMLKNSYSVIAYPVGYHIDIFKENNPSFENKSVSFNQNVVCLVMEKEEVVQVEEIMYGHYWIGEDPMVTNNVIFMIAIMDHMLKD